MERGHLGTIKNDDFKVLPVRVRAVYRLKYTNTIYLSIAQLSLVKTFKAKTKKEKTKALFKPSGGVCRILSVLFMHLFYLSSSIHAFLAYTLNPSNSGQD